MVYVKINTDLEIIYYKVPESRKRTVYFIPTSGSFTPDVYYRDKSNKYHSVYGYVYYDLKNKEYLFSKPVDSLQDIKIFFKKVNTNFVQFGEDDFLKMNKIEVVYIKNREGYKQWFEPVEKQKGQELFFYSLKNDTDIERVSFENVNSVNIAYKLQQEELIKKLEESEKIIKDLKYRLEDLQEDKKISSENTENKDLAKAQQKKRERDKKIFEENSQKIKQYLLENSKASIQDIAEAIGISRQSLYRSYADVLLQLGVKIKQSKVPEVPEIKKTDKEIFEAYFENYCLENSINTEKKRKSLIKDLETYCTINDYKEYIEYLEHKKSFE